MKQFTKTLTKLAPKFRGGGVHPLGTGFIVNL